MIAEIQCTTSSALHPSWRCRKQVRCAPATLEPLCPSRHSPYLQLCLLLMLLTTPAHHNEDLASPRPTRHLPSKASPSSCLSSLHTTHLYYIRHTFTTYDTPSLHTTHLYYIRHTCTTCDTPVLPVTQIRFMLCHTIPHSSCPHQCFLPQWILTTAARQDCSCCHWRFTIRRCAPLWPPLTLYPNTLPFRTPLHNLPWQQSQLHVAHVCSHAVPHHPSLQLPILICCKLL
jgi:hypothetical protein